MQIAKSHFESNCKSHNTHIHEHNTQERREFGIIGIGMRVILESQSFNAIRLYITYILHALSTFLTTGVVINKRMNGKWRTKERERDKEIERKRVRERERNETKGYEEVIKGKIGRWMDGWIDRWVTRVVNSITFECCISTKSNFTKATTNQKRGRLTILAK